MMATPDGAPLLLLDHVDQGRVAMLLSDQIWLWSRGHEGGGPQAELLRRIAHWLMKEPALDEEALRARIEDGRLVVERRTLTDAPPGEVTVTAPDGAVTRLQLTSGDPGRSSAAMPAPQPGVWAVSDGTRQAFAAATDANPREFADLRATATILAPITRASSGSIRFTGAGVPELRRIEPGRDTSGAGWIGLPRRHDHVVTGLDALPCCPPGPRCRCCSGWCCWHGGGKARVRAARVKRTRLIRRSAFVFDKLGREQCIYPRRLRPMMRRANHHG